MYRKRRFRLVSKLGFHFRRAIKISAGLFNRLIRIGVFSFDMCSTFWQREPFIYADGDFVRNSSLELVAREINEHSLAGSVAELGVFRGDYAKLINLAFPNRKLYLFDTFDGFDDRDESLDKQQGFILDIDDFSDTSVNLVLKKMRYPDNCIVKKGYFPETAHDLKEKFVFVSIDCDLKKPILAGLEYFWKHLEKGGYIFVHDYQTPCYSGVKAAVKEFCGQNNIPYFLMSDSCGSVCLSKPLGNVTILEL